MKFKLSLLFVLSFVHVAVGQIQYDEVATVTYRIDHKGVIDNEIDSLFLATHARSIGKADSSVAINLVFELITRVNPAGSRASLASVYFQFIEWNLDGKYMDIPFSVLLLPSNCSFDLEVVDQQKRSLFKEKISKSALQPKGFIADVQVPFLFKTGINSIRISNINFRFGSDIFTKYEEFKSLVNDYQLLDDDINISKRLLGEIINGQPEKIAGHKKNLDQMLVFVNEALQSPIIKDLGLREYDPLNVLKKLSELKEEVIARRKLIYQELNGLDIKLFNDGVRYALDGNLDSAAYFYQKARLVNPNFLPAAVELAYLDFEKGRISSSRSSYLEINIGDRPDPESISRYKKLGVELFQYHWLKAKQKALEGNYEDALAWLQYAEGICSKSNYMMCEDSLPYLQMFWAKEDYLMTLDFVKKSIRDGSFELAHVQFQQAKEKRIKLEMAYALADLPELEKGELSNISRGLEEISQNAEKSGSNALALQMAIQARTYQTLLDKREALVSKLTDQVLPSNDSSGILILIDDLMHRSLQANLDFKLPQQALEICPHFQAYADSIAEAYKYYNRKDFRRCAETLSYASKYLRSYGNCRLALNGAEERIDVFNKLAEYQQRLMSAHKAWQERNGIVFFNNYAESEYLYFKHKLYQRGVSHTPLFQFVSLGSAELKYEAALYYAATDQFEKAIEMIADSELRTQKPKETKNLEEIIAEKLTAWVRLQKPFYNYNAFAVYYKLNRIELKSLSKKFAKAQNGY